MSPNYILQPRYMPAPTRMLRRMPRGPTDHTSLEAENILQPATQPPGKQLSTEAPEVPNTKKNRSLEGNNETRPAATDDKVASTDPEEDPTTSVTTAKMKLKRNDEEEYVPIKEATNKIPEDGDINERKYDKPLDDDNASENSNEERADYRPDTGANNKPTGQGDESVYAKPPNNDKIYEVKDEVTVDYKPDTGANDNSTESGGSAEELIEGVDDARTHDGEYASEQAPESTHRDNKMTFKKTLDGGDSDTTNKIYMEPSFPPVPPSQDHHASYLTSARSSPDTSSMKADFNLDFDFDHMHDSLSRVDTTALMTENDHLQEMLVTQLDLIQQQAKRSEKQFLEEFLVLKNRISRLEDIALRRQKEPTEEIPTIPTPPQELQRQQKFWLPPPRQDPNKIMMEYNIPKSIVNILMVRAKEQDSIMKYLRDICYTANIWIPYHEIRDRSPFRKLLLMGWTKEVVDDARDHLQLHQR
jgi:hypothetical protein